MEASAAVSEAKDKEVGQLGVRAGEFLERRMHLVSFAKGGPAPKSSVFLVSRFRSSGLGGDVESSAEVRCKSASDGSWSILHGLESGYRWSKRERR
jgi:hypothetical protein